MEEVEKAKELTKLMERLYQVFHDDNHYHFEKDNIKIDITVHTYLKEFIPNGIRLNSCDFRFRSVDKVSPLEEQFTSDVIAFQYYDTKEVEIDGERYNTKKHCISKKIYLGQRISHEELIEKSKSDARLIPYVNYLNLEVPESIIYCDNGTIVTNIGDDAITLEELRKEYEDSKTYKKTLVIRSMF